MATFPPLPEPPEPPRPTRRNVFATDDPNLAWSHWEVAGVTLVVVGVIVLAGMGLPTLAICALAALSLIIAGARITLPRARWLRSRTARFDFVLLVFAAITVLALYFTTN